MNDFFETINQEFEAAEKKKKDSLPQYFIEAYQIIRLVKSPSGSKGLTTRIILDTLKVELGNTDIIKRRAINRAKVMGNCMVVEKSEKTIGSYL